MIYTNFTQSFVFRDTARRITARMVRSRGAMTLSEVDAESQYDPKHKAFTINTHHTGSSSSRRSMNGHTPPMRIGTPPVDCGSPQVPSPTHPNDHNPNRLSQFTFAPFNAIRNARQSILPSYHSAAATSPEKSTWPNRRPASSLYSRTTSGEPAKRRFWQRKQEEEVPHVPEISYPLNVNPQFAHLVRPDMAHHPSVRRENENDFDKI
jgi:hypothetical protein